MSKLLAQNILQDNDYTGCRSDLLKGLMTADHEKVIGAFNHLLASTPYDDFTNAARQSISDHDYDFTPQEWLYRSTILAFLRGCGVIVAGEMHTNRGRADIVVAHRGRTWVVEIKVAYEGASAEKKAEEAIRQIIDNNYAAPYPDATRCVSALYIVLRQIVVQIVDRYIFQNHYLIFIQQVERRYCFQVVDFIRLYYQCFVVPVYP